LFRGVTFATIQRDQPYHFIRLGTYLERGDNTARILSVNSDTRLKAAPDIPTSVEAGIPDMRVQVFNAVFTPAGVPREVLEFLRATHNKIRNDPAFLQDLEKAGADPYTGADAEKFIADEVGRWTNVIKATQFKIT
jgi:tripartite-type tricarboxylate transporter receptor subunit TctC